MIINVYSNGWLTIANLKFRCALGKNSITIDKTEGDKASPAGCFPIRQVFYRPDRLTRPSTTLPITPINPTMGWCDDDNHQDYNQFITLPHLARHEKLWRKDHVYDLILVLGYNDQPVMHSKGSAIFIHLCRKNYEATQGCIALNLADLLVFLSLVGTTDLVCIKKQPLNNL